MIPYLKITPVKGTGGYTLIKDFVKNIKNQNKRILILDWTEEYSFILEEFEPNKISFYEFYEFIEKLDDNLIQIIPIHLLNYSLEQLYLKEFLENEFLLKEIKTDKDFDSYKNNKIKDSLNNLDGYIDFILEIKLSED